MNEQRNDFEIADIYYADCHRQSGPMPQWSTVRSGQQLTDERSLNRLRKQLRELRRKRTKLEFTFGDEVIEVEHPRNASVRSVLQRILDLPTDDQALEELQQYGDVLAQKYLKTPYSRTRLFMVARVVLKDEMHLFLLVTHLNPEFAGECIQPESLDFISQTIPNLIRELKKGAIYPAVSEGRRNENAILIYDSGDTKYYPQSLECILRQAPETEARSLIKVIGETCTPTTHQLTSVLSALRTIERPSFGSNELVQVLEQTGVEVDPEQVSKEWRKQFNYSQYEIPPTVLSLESVKVIIRLDEFEINCPLSYYPDRIEHSEEGGYHYLKVRGREYRELRTGPSRIRFALRDD